MMVAYAINIAEPAHLLMPRWGPRGLLLWAQAVPLLEVSGM
jgi:hypothetical protein